MRRLTAPMVLIVGPTAAGKSAIALDLAERLNGEIVSADSMQVYRGLDRATAKPSAAERARVPHHLIDAVEPGRDFSMGEFVRAADAAIGSIVERGRVPFVVGGTGLYVRGLMRGIVPAPPRDTAVRDRLLAEAEASGVEALHARLESCDPETARRITPRDLQRIVRALEVLECTRQPLSAHIRASGFGPDRYRAVKIAVTRPRAKLYERIDRRVGVFFESGLVEEVRELFEGGCRPESNAFKALAYREVAAHLRGELDLEEAIELTRRNTRRYAKRQLTWFRKEAELHWFDLEDPRQRESITPHVETQLASLRAA